MAGGFFGGLAEGLDDASQRRTQQQQVDQQGIYQRGTLQIQQQRMQNEQQREMFTRADKEVSNAMSGLIETAQALVQQGKTPAEIYKVIGKPFGMVKDFSARVGRDPSMLEAQMAAAIAQPSAGAMIQGATGGDKVSANYGPQIASAAQQYGIPPDILHNTIRQESGGNPNAVNAKSGAAGIAQFTPETAKDRGVNAMDPNSAIPGAASYLADLKGQFGGNMGLALAAYNWGPGNVQKWLQAGADPAKLPAETRNYVQSITGKPIEAAMQPQMSETDKWTLLMSRLPANATPAAKEAVKLRLQNAIKQETPDASVHFMKPDDGGPEIPLITTIQNGRVSITDTKGNPYEPPTTEDGKSNADAIADAIIEGKQPPTTTGLYKEAKSVRGKLARKGFDQTSALLEWNAAQKQVQSLNGPQMTRYAGLAKSVVNTIDEVKRLAVEMDNSGVPALNALKLESYIQAEGNSKNGILASQYQAAINTLKEEFANLANGGYAPTEPAWTLANQQINGNYGVKQLPASLTEVQRLIRYRLQGIPNFQTLGPDAPNRYKPAGGGGESGGGEKPPANSPAIKDWTDY